MIGCPVVGVGEKRLLKLDWDSTSRPDSWVTAPVSHQHLKACVDIGPLARHETRRRGRGSVRVAHSDLEVRKTGSAMQAKPPKVDVSNQTRAHTVGDAVPARWVNADGEGVWGRLLSYMC